MTPSACHRTSSLWLTLKERSATGKSGGVKLWAEDESVLHQQLAYLDLSADSTRSTIAVAFSTDG